MDFQSGTYTLERSDDLLSEILLRLPSKSIFKFTCVSRRWNDIITYHSFRKLYRERTRRSLACSNPQGKLLGMVQGNNKFGTYNATPSLVEHKLLPVLGEEYIRVDARGSGFIPVQCGYFITSSKDGLILCGRIPEIYCVGDRITGKWETLPPPPPPEGYPENCLSVGLSSNEEEDGLGGKIKEFRVIVATGRKKLVVPGSIPGSKTIPIETYSSRTREWRRLSLISEIPVCIKHAETPTVSGGFFHWFTTDRKYIVGYDPCSLDEEDDDYHNNRRSTPKKERRHVVQVTSTPRGLGSIVVWRSDNGQTMWYATSSLLRGVEVFQKCVDSDDWALRSRVESMESVRNDILGLTRKDIELEMEWNEGFRGQVVDNVKTHRVMVWLLAFIPWNPKLIVIKYGDRIYIYDYIKKKLDCELMLEGDRCFTCKGGEWYPYFHSLSSS